jgi:hypothetical protein
MDLSHLKKTRRRDRAAAARAAVHGIVCLTLIIMNQVVVNDTGRSRSEPVGVAQQYRHKSGESSDCRRTTGPDRMVTARSQGHNRAGRATVSPSRAAAEAVPRLTSQPGVPYRHDNGA